MGLIYIVDGSDFLMVDRSDIYSLWVWYIKMVGLIYIVDGSDKYIVEGSDIYSWWVWYI